MALEWYTADWLLTPGNPPLKSGRIGIDKATGRIGEVESASQLPQKDISGTTFLTPGLINAHTHLEMYANSPIPVTPDETMADWILKVIARNREMTDTDRRQATQRSILEMIRTGTTCVNDITTTGASLEGLSQVGMRGIVSPEFFHPFHTPPPNVEAIIQRFHDFEERFGHHPLLSLGISPHSPYNVTADALATVLKHIHPTMVHTHLAETREEVAWFQAGQSALDKVHELVLGQQFGPAQSATTPVESFRSLLDKRWIAAHGVFLTDEEINLLANLGVSIAHCPRSNFWISGKTIPDLKKLQQAGIAVGLGTDSRYSSPDLDLRAEGRAARQAHHLTAQETFELMTAGSAQAIKQADSIGHLSSAMMADIVLWWNPATTMPDNPYELWLSPETEAQMVLINGRIVLERDLPTILSLAE